MKIILKEYLASLKERGDLDKSVLPNLLSQIGLRVLNTPMIGTRQNGVDIAAVGKIHGEDEERFLYLFCIKAGNVTRRDWEVSEQAVRPELNEIRDVYLRTNVAQEYRQLPVKICLCCGGELDETVLMNWAGYTESHTTENVRYEEWNGDRLAELMMRSLLARELLADESRRNFQKAVAMVNEPSACYDYTRACLSSILQGSSESPKLRILKLRQAYICLHAISAWSIDSGNLESIYRISELGMLCCWNAIKDDALAERKTKHKTAVVGLMDQFIKMYLTNSERYFEKVVYPHCRAKHALSVAVGSREPVDVNLALFEMLGRLAARGIWTNFFARAHETADPPMARMFREATAVTLDVLVALINSNPTLCSPVKDDHMIEISLVMYLAQQTGSVERFVPWVESVAEYTTVALLISSQYPTCFSDYNDLLRHPRSADQSYRDEACCGSVLYPYLFMWLLFIAKPEDTKEFATRISRSIPNCTHQAWLPGEASDERMWMGGTDHGVCVTDLSPQKGGEEFIHTLNQAMQFCTKIEDISALKFNLVPLFLAACRHHRLPLPPNFWSVGT